MFKRIVASALIFGAVTAASPVLAQQMTSCGDRDKIVATLEKRHGEAPIGAGLAGETAVVELWSSAKTGTWTLIITRTDGVACLLAAGDAWMEDHKKLTVLGDPS